LTFGAADLAGLSPWADLFTVHSVRGPLACARYGVGDAGALYLVRPDGYIGWRSPGTDPAGLIDHLQGVFLPR
jgi:hypothetical protein